MPNDLTKTNWKRTLTLFLLKVYQNQTQFCIDVYHFIPIQTVALLSRLLMQFVCLNTVLNPVIYALSHKEFKLGLFHRRRRPCWPYNAGLDSPWGHFTIAEASVLPSSNFTLWFTRQKGGQVLISKSNKNFTCITTLQLPRDPIFVSKRLFWTNMNKIDF